MSEPGDFSLFCPSSAIGRRHYLEGVDSAGSNPASDIASSETGISLLTFGSIDDIIIK